MEIRIRRVPRTWLERLFLWERAYEARLHRDQEEISERGKTPEAAQDLSDQAMPATFQRWPTLEYKRKSVAI